MTPIVDVEKPTITEKTLPPNHDSNGHPLGDKNNS